MATAIRLVDQLMKDISPEQRMKLDFIDDFDYRKIGRKVDRDLHGLTPDYLEQGIENLKRYYVLALLDPNHEHAVSRPVDPFWHAHVLFSKEYMAFCDMVYGGYVHHIPLDQDDSSELKHVGKLYAYTLETLGKIFKSIDPGWWPALRSGETFRLVCKFDRVGSI